MKAPDIKQVICQAKQVKAKTPRSVINKVLGDLVACVEYLSEELNIKLEQKNRSDRSQFGRQSESIKELKNQESIEDIKDKLKELLKEAQKLAPKDESTPPSLKEPKREHEVHKANSLDEFCPICKGRLVDQGQYRVAEEIDVEESRFIKRRHYLHKARCKCGGSKMKVPSPVRGVPGTLYSPRFIARLICDKFRLSLPLYRQFAVIRSEGLDMSRSTLTRLLHKHVDTMAPIVERLWKYNKLAEYRLGPLILDRSKLVVL